MKQLLKKGLHPGSRIKDAHTHRKSFWTETIRIDVELPDKTLQSYFLKTGTGDNGLSMLRGEFEGARVIHKYTPNGIPRPIAWGTFKSDPNTHFYLCEFIDMKEELPNIGKFSAMLAKLHQDSMSDKNAPDEFGFHVMTHEGSMYQDIFWCKTWEEMCTRRFQSFVDQERISQGPSEELDEIVPQFISKVIPRLLRPLVTHGRSIKPVALHADIWSSNTDVNRATGEPIYFDPSVFWGHHEFDLQCMLTPRYGFGREWMEAYFRHFDASEPKEESKDRNLLYAISSHFCASTLYPTDKSYRKMAIEDMKRLLDKFPKGYQGE
ncbi:Protein-ribulosamine 3-kinase [Fusarium keratoplasticum]|nr:Protein-ribulosamine 3-kinase [Fusarium keratoplasticum]